ncbi:hypothetical protein CH254_06355 [Rhodococcus sp. 06-412-2C]|uniref:hypothetical protein n=1 Tax=unclassified Rhodococcus (in: high G+C Gram-positive bacteria) TaxID=192944 RepID=UPI000B9B5A38|nr:MULTISPECIES: hypothetical protein [unclassified Rhodococcus (in: high G+C Gram-positive bacteria)]OZC90560.1 hypothetical protein CH254_06355 [Rhodococcus sp. 06-412-2C]OZC98183.1 hypothetical protein CH279_11640 [Rhodococcus sp. 06-412-2B]
MLLPSGDRRRSIAWRAGDSQVNTRRRRVGVIVAACGVGASMLASCAASEPTASEPRSGGIETWCTPTDSGLSELSGLAWTGDTGYAIGDRGSDDRLAVLGRACEVTRWVDVGVETVDVEDIAVDSAGIVWLADTGDNNSERESVTLIGVDVRSDRRTSVSLRYPDGAHDVEAFALTPTGQPVLITKVSGSTAASIYSSAESVTAGVQAIDLVHSGTVSATAADGSSRPITGAAVDADATVGALRTKKDLFVFDIADGDVAAAFSGDPTGVVEGPDQPQGEAVAFTDAGELLLASEADGATELPPIVFAAPN